MSLTRWFGALFAALLLLTGCSGAASNEDGETTKTGEEAAEAAELPDGFKWVTATGAGVKFGVPENWQEFGPEVVDDPGVQVELEAMADRSGIPLEQWKQLLSQLDVIALSPEGDENVNMVPPTALPAMPSEDDIRRDYAHLGAEISSIDDVTTRIGSGRAANYALPPNAVGVVQYGVTVFVDTDNGIVNLTGTTLSLDRSIELTDQVTATLSYAE